MKTPFTFAFNLFLACTSFAQPGALDSSFGNSGYAVFDSGARTEEARAIVQQGDGKLLVAGFYRDYPEASRYLIARFTPAGQPDLTFGTGGLAEIDIVGRASGLALQPDGKIVVAGSHYCWKKEWMVAQRCPCGICLPGCMRCT